jgi:hypothetical protein
MALDAGTCIASSNACEIVSATDAGCVVSLRTCPSPGSCQTGGTCNATSGACEYQNRVGTCDDSNACTTTDVCQNGACVGTAPTRCSTRTACFETSVCIPADGGCTATLKPEGAACDDGDACSGTDTCTLGRCLGSIRPATFDDFSSGTSPNATRWRVASANTSTNVSVAAGQLLVNRSGRLIAAQDYAVAGTSAVRVTGEFTSGAADDWAHVWTRSSGVAGSAFQLDSGVEFIVKPNELELRSNGLSIATAPFDGGLAVGAPIVFEVFDDGVRAQLSVHNKGVANELLLSANITGSASGAKVVFGNNNDVTPTTGTSRFDLLRIEHGVRTRPSREWTFEEVNPTATPGNLLGGFGLLADGGSSGAKVGRFVSAGSGLGSTTGTTVAGAVTSGAFGAAASISSASGGRFVELPGDSIAASGRDLSVSFWYLGTTPNGMGEIFGNRSEGSGGTFLSIRGDLTGASVEFDQGNTGNRYVPVNGTSSARRDDGLWHHLVVTREGRQHAIYIDGQLAGSVDAGVTSPIADFAKATPYWAGRGYDSNGNGAFDELRIYDDVALNACEVSRLSTRNLDSAACTGGRTLCVANASSSGVCVDVQTDTANCGACGVACTTGQSCLTGSCRTLCGPGTAACPAVGSTVCASLATDTTNCGVCGAACATGCQSGYCPAQPAVTINTTSNLSTVNLPGRTCSQGGEMVRYQVTALTASSATVTVAPAAGCLSVGDELLLINLQGTGTSTQNVGNYEFVRVSAVAGPTITFASPKTRFYGTGAADDANLGTTRTTQRVVLQRVPVFNNLNISSSANLTADAWDGTAGGVFAMRATSRIQSSGVIDMRAKGYVGGAQVTTTFGGGSQGESIGGLGAISDRPSGGAGAGGRGDSSPGCNPNGQPVTFGSAAGGAGHATWGTRATSFCGGHGGAPIGSPTMTRIFLGSGGGSGGADNTLADNPPGGAGGRGGGIVLLLAPAVELAGTVDVSGADGQGDPPGTDCRAPANTASTTSCWDASGPGGGGSGGSFFSTAGFFSGLSSVRSHGGIGGDGTLNLSGIAGRGSYGRTLPLPVTCSDLHPGFGDGEYLFAFAGDPQRPYLAFCLGVGTANARMYLTLHNRVAAGQGGQNFARYNASQFTAGPNNIIVSRFQRVRFDPATRRLAPGDFTFTTSTGAGVGGPFGGNPVTQYPLGYAGDCNGGGSTSGGSNIDLRGLPFAIATSNTWTLIGFIPGGSTTFFFDRQVVDVTGGGFCGGNGPSTFGGEIELTYLAPRSSCQAIKTALPTASDGVWAVAQDPAFGPIPVTCDMTYEGGGWSLLADGNAQPVQSLREASPIQTASSTHLPFTLMRALATQASVIHLRQTAAPLTRSFVTAANATPIQNLRQGLIISNGFSAADYTPIGVNISTLAIACPPNSKGWPNFYHACGTQFGVHFLNDVASWTNSTTAEPFQVYVR